MARKAKSTDTDGAAPQWTVEELTAVQHLGPAIIGAEMYAAAQALNRRTAGGMFGPAILADSPEDVPRLRAELGG